MDVNKEFLGQLKKRWPWLQVQQFHRNEKIRITHERVVDHGKITNTPQCEYEYFFPCVSLIEANSEEEFIRHVENHVLQILAGLNVDDKEALNGLKCYLGFTDISYAASDDGDGYERYSTALGLIRIVGEDAWTTMGGRAVPVNVPEPTEAELVALEEQVRERNRLEQVEALTQDVEKIDKPVRIVIQGGHSIQDAIRHTRKVLGRLEEMVRTFVPQGTYMKVTPSGVDYADAPSPVVQLVGFDNIDLEITTEQGPRQMIHLMAGDDNWDPTAEELQQLVELFQDATVVGGSIVSTSAAVKIKDGLKAEIVYVEPGAGVTVERTGIEHSAEFIDLSLEEVNALYQAVKPGGGSVAIGNQSLKNVVGVSVEYGRLFTKNGMPVNNKVTVKYTA